MFVVELTYIKPLEEVELYLEQHRSFLAQCYERGLFLASGPKVPRTGGMILVKGDISKEQLEALIEEDPFKQQDIAQYTITEFTVAKSHPAIGEYL